MSQDHNQRIGFGRFGKTAHGREDYRKKSRGSTKEHLTEVTIAEAKGQLLATGEIKRIISVIGRGKEATVLLAESVKEELICAKVFRYFTSTIKKRLRGTIHLLPSDMAILAAKQEYWNLVEMHKNIPVPKPHLLLDNIVIMEFISDERGSSNPASLLKDTNLHNYDPEELLHESIDILAQLFLNSSFIHGDYSEHNLMLTQEGVLITMDVSQSVQYNSKTFIETPIRIRVDKAVKLLETDIKNINQHFRRIYRISIDPQEVVMAIVEKLPQKLQDFLTEKTMDIYPSALHSPEVLAGKEQYRDEIFYQRTKSFRQQPK